MMLLTPPPLPRVPMGLVKCPVQCVPAYTLSSPALKGVTRGMDFKHTPTDTFPLPVTPGTCRCGRVPGANQ